MRVTRRFVHQLDAPLREGPTRWGPYGAHGPSNERDRFRARRPNTGISANKMGTQITVNASPDPQSDLPDSHHLLLRIGIRSLRCRIGERGGHGLELLGTFLASFDHKLGCCCPNMELVHFSGNFQINVQKLWHGPTVISPTTKRYCTIRIPPRSFVAALNSSRPGRERPQDCGRVFHANAAPRDDALMFQMKQPASAGGV